MTLLAPPADARGAARTHRRGPGPGRGQHGSSLADRLLVAPGTAASRLPAHVKVVALLAFVLAVVSTPPTRAWAFAGYAALVAAAVAAARLPVRTLLARMSVELPFVAFALLLPFVATGERVQVLGLALSEDGLLGAWNLLAKATLGVAAAVVLGATTSAHDLLDGLQRLRVPGRLVEIASFMVRYVDVVRDDLRRMRVARDSRGFSASHLGHARVLARAAGALFIRTYERGERVHLAMLSRGYAGALPLRDPAPATRRQWAAGLVLPAAAAVVALTARLPL